MLGNYYTLTELLLWIPLLTGCILFFIKKNSIVKAVAIISSLATLAVSVISLFYSDVAHHPEYAAYINVSYVWLPYIGSSFSVGLDGMGFLLTFLTAFTYPLLLACIRNRELANANIYYALWVYLWQQMHCCFISFGSWHLFRCIFYAATGLVNLKFVLHSNFLFTHLQVLY